MLLKMGYWYYQKYWSYFLDTNFLDKKLYKKIYTIKFSINNANKVLVWEKYLIEIEKIKRL